MSYPLTAREGKGPGSDCDTGNLIAHTLRASGCDGSEDGTGRGTPMVVDTLRSHPRPGSNTVGALAFNWQSGGRCDLQLGEHALSTKQTPAVAYDMQNGGIGELCGTLQSEGQATGNRGYGVLGFALNQRREGRLQEQAGAVHEPSGTQLEGALTPMGVRRLTPRECERLQGFPDDWTRYGRRENGTVYELADAPRYRALGNAVTVSVANWIARRIAALGAAP